MQIYVDADACPVKKEVEQVATRHGLTVTIVSNGGVRPSQNPIVQIIVVDRGPDEADKYIANALKISIVPELFVSGNLAEHASFEFYGK